MSFPLGLMQANAAEGHFQNHDFWSIRIDGQTENCVATACCVRASYQSGPQK